LLYSTCGPWSSPRISALRLFRISSKWPKEQLHGELTTRWGAFFLFVGPFGRENLVLLASFSVFSRFLNNCFLEWSGLISLGCRGVNINVICWFADILGAFNIIYKLSVGNYCLRFFKIKNYCFIVKNNKKINSKQTTVTEIFFSNHPCNT